MCKMCTFYQFGLLFAFFVKNICVFEKKNVSLRRNMYFIHKYVLEHNIIRLRPTESERMFNVCLTYVEGS